MYNKYSKALDELRATSNFRNIRTDINNLDNIIDLSSNDYLGIAANENLRCDFFSNIDSKSIGMTSAASRLLSLHQQDYLELEDSLKELYNRDILLFNSGYHANTGIVSALCDKETLVIADKLVHASIIDGIVLSRAQFVRFRHNDLAHLKTLLDKNADIFKNILIITESVFSMDGDICDLKALVDLKHHYPNVMLYVDEAHGFGTFGKLGLGVAERENVIADIDILVGTFGKAAASSGSFVATDSILKDYLINNARSFIFSTALPPICCKWTKYVLEKIVNMQSEREHLQKISKTLSDFLNGYNNGINSSSQIIPLVIGNSEQTLNISYRLQELGFIALPIRTPTVPLGTERIRFSLSAAVKDDEISKLIENIKSII